MFEDLVTYLQGNPYLGVAVVFVLCGIGLPLPEEVALIAAGYICFLAKTQLYVKADFATMVTVCGFAILAGDLIPFLLGKLFGPRLLRLRLLRYIVTRERLATFDRWFRRRGDTVIFFARFVPGLRVVAFFTGGAMQMRWRRFLLLDGAGILIATPFFVWVGYRFGDVIEDALRRVMQVERGLLYTAIGAAVAGAAYWWWRRRRRRQVMQRGPREAYVEPTSTQTIEPEQGSAEPAPGPVLKGPGSARDNGDDGRLKRR